MCTVDKWNEELKVQRKYLYPAYISFCRDNGLNALSKEQFFSEIINLGVKKAKVRMNGSTALHGFRGIMLNSCVPSER